MSTETRNRVLQSCKTARHASKTRPPDKRTARGQLAEFAASVGGWRVAAKRLGVNVGTLHHIARGHRQAKPDFVAAFNAIGWRPSWFTAGALAIVAWAEQAAPRPRWTRARMKGLGNAKP